MPNIPHIGVQVGWVQLPLWKVHDLGLILIISQLGVDMPKGITNTFLGVINSLRHFSSHFWKVEPSCACLSPTSRRVFHGLKGCFLVFNPRVNQIGNCHLIRSHSLKVVDCGILMCQSVLRVVGIHGFVKRPREGRDEGQFCGVERGRGVHLKDRGLKQTHGDKIQSSDGDFRSSLESPFLLKNLINKGVFACTR